jgi:hypothetical protein
MLLHEVGFELLAHASHKASAGWGMYGPLLVVPAVFNDAALRTARLGFWGVASHQGQRD